MYLAIKIISLFTTYDYTLFYRNRLLVGLFKLSEANSLVGTMQDTLVNIGPQIEQKQKVGIVYWIFLLKGNYYRFYR